MKKLILERLKLAAEDVLHRSQLAGVYGGSGGGGTCGYSGGGPITAPFCGIDKATAMGLASQYGGNWCCDSCPSTWYCCPGSGW